MRLLHLSLLLLFSVAASAQGPVPLPPEEDPEREARITEQEHTGPSAMEERVAEDLFEDATKARRTARLVSSIGNVISEVMVVIDHGSFQLAGVLDEVGFVVADLFEARADSFERKGRWLLEEL